MVDKEPTGEPYRKGRRLVTPEMREAHSAALKIIAQTSERTSRARQVGHAKFLENPRNSTPLTEDEIRFVKDVMNASQILVPLNGREYGEHNLHVARRVRRKIEDFVLNSTSTVELPFGPLNPQ